MSTRVFVSYRRTDTRHAAGRLRDRLADEFGEDNVFYDVDSIGLVRDFRAVIREELGKVDAVLAVIGPSFDLGRLAKPDDYVRMELVEAMGQGKLVVPVLVDDAVMPAPDELPDELKPLSYYGAAVLRPDPDFRRDVARLVESLKRAIGPSTVAGTGSDDTPPAVISPPAAKRPPAVISPPAAKHQPARRPATAHASLESDRNAFLKKLQRQGFSLGAGAKHLYYHRDDPYPESKRIVIDGARIRFERRSLNEWQLVRSFRLTDESSLALAAIDQMKPKESRRTGDTPTATGRPTQGWEAAREDNRKRLIRQLERLGFYSMTDAKRTFYHTGHDYYGKNERRLVIGTDRMRVELRKSYASDWSLVQSYHLVHEVDQAIEAVKQVHRQYAG